MLCVLVLPITVCLLRTEPAGAINTNQHNNNQNPADTDKWMSGVSQYGTEKYWSRFRDEVEDDSFRTWSSNKAQDKDFQGNLLKPEDIHHTRI